MDHLKKAKLEVKLHKAKGAIHARTATFHKGQAAHYSNKAIMEDGLAKRGSMSMAALHAHLQDHHQQQAELHKSHAQAIADMIDDMHSGDLEDVNVHHEPSKTAVPAGMGHTVSNGVERLFVKSAEPSRLDVEKVLSSLERREPDMRGIDPEFLHLVQPRSSGSSDPLQAALARVSGSLNKADIDPEFQALVRPRGAD